jgi:uncharacterized protein YndB with AHSA1/START domain
MPVTSVTTDPESLTMTLVAQFPVTVERLWEAFTQPAQLERFWGPPGWPARFTDHDFTVGGIASYHMTSPQGERAGGRWEFLAIDPPRSFEVVDAFIGDDGAVNTELPSMRMTFEFREAEGGAELRNTTYFPTVDGLEQVVAMGAIEGATMAFNQLDRVLQGLREFALGKGTQVELLSDTHVLFTRLIEAPRDLVWKAYTTPELVARWLLGPDGWTMPICEIDLQVGGKYRYGWAPDPGQEGEAFGFHGQTMHLDTYTYRWVVTEQMTGMDHPPTLNDLQLIEEDGATLLSIMVEYPDQATRDMVLATGMVGGMERSFERLDEILG